MSTRQKTGVAPRLFPARTLDGALVKGAELGAAEGGATTTGSGGGGGGARALSELIANSEGAELAGETLLRISKQQMNSKSE